MSKFLSVTVLALLLTAGAASAQTPAPVGCEAEVAALYNFFLDRSGPGWRQQHTGYERTKEYLSKCGEMDDDVTRYIKSWVAKYDAAVREFETRRLLSSLAAQDAEAKERLYTRSQRGAQSPQEKRAAYLLGKEYLRKYGKPEDDIVRYIRHWVEKYEVELGLRRRVAPPWPRGPRAVCRLREQ